jgi:glycosyltransferase involved in cell wall biosynthesis
LKSLEFRPPQGHTLSTEDATLTATIVICTRHRPALLRCCLAAVSRLDPQPDEVLVVDNSSGDPGTECVAREFGARYTVEPLQGLSRARNHGLAESTSEIVAYIDDDAEPDPQWLGKLLDPFKDEQVAATAGRVITPESRRLAAEDHKPRPLSKWEPHWFEIATFGGLGMGCNMALRRSACAGWKVFDERLGRGAPLHIGEETHAFALLLSRGHTAVSLPDAIVYHPPSTRDTIANEARNSISYWLLLFSEFPQHRMDLLRFLAHRLRRENLPWFRESQEPGEIISSGWRVLLKAGLSGLILFLRTPKHGPQR